MHAGELVLQQAAASLLVSVNGANARQLADITAGLADLQCLGCTIAAEAVQQIRDRKKQLMVVE